MKNLLLFSLLMVALVACRKEGAPTDPLNEMVSDTAVLKYTGDFENGPWGTVMGKASIYKLNDASYQLKLDSFNSSNGPKLKVFLSKEIMPVTYVDLGDLKSTNGSQVYDITTIPDFAAYKYACVHCVDYNHLFGYALLK